MTPLASTIAQDTDTKVGRVTSGLQVLYDFSGTGPVVEDRSGVGKPLNLRIGNMSAVVRAKQSLEIHGPAEVRSAGPATKVIDAVKRSKELTIEAWIRTANQRQQGPARIVTLSKNTVDRNFTLGQENGSFDVRFRTSSTDANGLPSLATPENTAVTKLTHLVYTRSRTGQARLYLNGEEASRRDVKGSLSSWQSGFRLALADELTGSRPWQGTFHLVAIYSRAVNGSEVRRNFKAGHEGPELVRPPSVPATKIASDRHRVGAGLQVLYDFREVDGNLVKDRAGIGRPIDLRIKNLKRVKREHDALRITGNTVLESVTPVKRLVDAIRRSGSITVEAWVRPDNLNQKGPARILTFSKNANERNVTLGQEGDQVEARLRTTNTSNNGIPAIRTESRSLSDRLTHLVFTRDRSGKAKIYVDGRQRKQGEVSGSLQNWNDSYQLGLANELTGDRPWLGELHLVAVYSRDLSAADVASNFKAGAGAATAMQLAGRTTSHTNRFESQIAPILAQHCLECHDSAAKQGGLDLSRKAAAFAGGDSGVAIVAGKASESLLWQSVEEDAMPHDRPPLSDSEKQQLREWIDADAQWTIDFVDRAIYRHGRQPDNWVQRLTTPEYIQTVRTAVGVDIAEDARKMLPTDKRADGFRNTAYNLNVDLGHVEAYARLAEIIVAKMDTVAFARRFSKSRLLTDDSMRGLIAEMGKWVLRGPLDSHEVAVYRGISTSVASAGGDFREAVAFILEAMLQSPRFVYRIENQRGDGTSWPVGEYELASRISYILWGAPPDKELFDAAESGDLSDPDQLDYQIARMLKDPRAVEQSKMFLIQWLNLDRLDNMRPNPQQFPAWKEALAQDMREETIAFFKELVWDRNLPLVNLLNAQFTYATPQLAKHYGIPAQGERFERYDLAKIASRGGLLTHGSVLTIGGDDASMVTRGLFVLNDLLFSEVGDPPPGLDVTPVPTSPGRTHRAIAIERIESAACGGCHSRFEPLAFGLEKFDGLGSYHENDEHGNQLREDGEILFPGQSKPVTYQTAAELMDLLAKSDRVQQCLTRKVTQFALGRPLYASDAPIIRAIDAQSQKEGGTYGSLMKAIILSELVQTTTTEVENTRN